MHVRDDLMVPLEAGRQLAAGIPGARFIALPGRNHLFLEHEPASDRFFEEISLFLRVVVQTLEVEPIRDLEVTTYHAASTAFQISGAVLFLTRSWPSLN